MKWQSVLLGLVGVSGCRLDGHWRGTAVKAPLKFVSLAFEFDTKTSFNLYGYTSDGAVECQLATKDSCTAIPKSGKLEINSADCIALPQSAFYANHLKDALSKTNTIVAKQNADPIIVYDGGKFVLY
eukprot:Protomagalhaensia_wolfi_Nauph_80__4469@NODE_457_length_2485_cov_384_355683_g343_i0_p4_GENE_NODE_457_length_2485_cov_384_355683_g343_i0NODE_457_length_2485_cov_384_355683_g343_i0_p4_ORF_typecomplete_len127_score24_89_NODE_457_length_2485_cov_384_355683_g343_i0124504